MSGIANIRHLSALRTFEAAARLHSFQSAASELNLTPSAVSHQIRRLELELGQPLFLRLTRAVKLTPTGERLHESVRRGLNEIARGLENIVSKRDGIDFRLSVAPFFAGLY